MSKVHVGFGGNVGDVEANLRVAIEAVGRLPGTRIRRVSSLFRTGPVGVTEQPEFLNGAVEIETALGPAVLLAALLEIEGSLGRKRERRWGPRTVDLDLLLWEDRVVRSRELEIPHPRLHERGFALAPLAEIAPQARHPVLHATVRELLAALGSQPDVRQVASAGWSAWAQSLEDRRP
jgi:2-amino-4-hydroxy-6-hydroxymethyldihydropteridine diphosphokinase